MGQQAESPPGFWTVEVHSGAAYLKAVLICCGVGYDGQPRNRLQSAAADAAEIGWYRGADFRPVRDGSFFDLGDSPGKME